jgi:PadR family transcriptional regulator PadR
MEKRGLIASTWDVTETGREAKFYRLTSQGAAQLDSGSVMWGRYVAAMARVLGQVREG